MPIVPLPPATEQAIIVPLPNAPVERDPWIMLPTNPPQVMRRSEYEKLLKEITHDQ